MIIFALTGTLAALCLFRWARTLALLAFAAALVWSVVAHAQSYPIVQCHVAAIVMETTDFQCEALLRGAKLIDVSRYQQTNSLCAHEVARHLDAPWQTFMSVCHEMAVGLLRDRVDRTGR